VAAQRAASSTSLTSYNKVEILLLMLCRQWAVCQNQCCAELGWQHTFAGVKAVHCSLIAAGALLLPQFMQTQRQHNRSANLSLSTSLMGTLEGQTYCF